MDSSTLVQLQREAAALVAFSRDAHVALGAAVAVDRREGGEAPVIAVAAPPVHLAHHLQEGRQRAAVNILAREWSSSRCVQEGGAGCRWYAPRASGKVCSARQLTQITHL